MTEWREVTDMKNLSIGIVGLVLGVAFFSGCGGGNPKLPLTIAD